MRLIPPFSNSSRVIRGGCWYATPSNARVAYRNRNTPGDRYYYLGFRLYLEVR